MNFNANIGPRQPFARKLKRVSDVNAMGYNPYNQMNETTLVGGHEITQPYSSEFIPQNIDATPLNNMTNIPNESMYSYEPANTFGSPQINTAVSPPQSQQPQLGMFAQPMMQDMALQYGQQLASTGKTIVKQELEKYVPVTRLKYYFAVDTKYVLSKLILLFFPFTHKDWSIKYEQDGPVQPRFELNAPDLYIPAMAYATYVLVGSLVLGTQQRFTPEQFGILSSSALAWCIVELLVYSCTLYITNIQTSLRTLDLLAYSGYKFVGIIISICLSLIGNRMAYYSTLAYCSIALAFFLVRSLKAQVLPDTSQPNTNYYATPPMTGNKRRLYFLLFVASVQPLLSWWLSYHLLGSNKVTVTSVGQQ